MEGKKLKEEPGWVEKYNSAYDPGKFHKKLKKEKLTIEIRPGKPYDTGRIKIVKKKRHGRK